MSWEKSSYTAAGAALLSESLSGGALVITRAVSGTGTADADLSGETGVSGETHDLKLLDIETVESGGETARRVKIQITGADETYIMHQVGVYGRLNDDAETLLFIMQDARGVEVPSTKVNGDFEIELSALLAVSNKANISITVDPQVQTLMKLVKAEIEKHNANADAHAATITAAVSAAVKNLSESGEILNEEQVKALIKEQVDGGTGGGYYGSYELTLAADGWKPARSEDDYENAGGMDYCQCIYDAELSDSTSELVPVGVVSPGSFYTTLTDRIRIEKWLKDGLRVKEIADRLRVDPSTVYRELKRGSYDKLDGKTWKLIPTYSPDIAEQRYQAHLREKGPNLKIGKDHELASYIEQTIIDKDCSPAAVYGYAMEEGRTFKTHISVPTIYSYIKKGVFLNLTQKALPRHGVHKGDYKKVKTKDPARAPAGESIEKRPTEVKDREEFGHWEMDTVYSGKKKSTVALLVLTERKTRNENIIVVPDRRAETTVRAINALERKLGAEKFGIIYKSITVDNGSEFALADQLEQSCITGDKRTKVYYCHPYSSWERGSNENVNGMIRRRHPKGTDFSKVTAEEIAATENWINSYPRKIFGYKSAGTMFRECLRELGLTA